MSTSSELNKMNAHAIALEIINKGLTDKEATDLIFTELQVAHKRGEIAAELPTWHSIKDDAPPPINEEVIGYDSWYDGKHICTFNGKRLLPVDDNDDVSIMYWAEMPESPTIVD